MEISEQVGVDLLRKLLDAFNRHDIDDVMACFSSRPVLCMPRGHEPYGTKAEGTDAVRKLLAMRFEGIPDVHYSEDRHLVCGDRGVSEWLLTGTTIDGEVLRVRGCDLFEFENNSIRVKDSYWKNVQ